MQTGWQRNEQKKRIEKWIKKKQETKCGNEQKEKNEIRWRCTYRVQILLFSEDLLMCTRFSATQMEKTSLLKYSPCQRKKEKKTNSNPHCNTFSSALFIMRKKLSENASLMYALCEYKDENICKENNSSLHQNKSSIKFKYTTRCFLLFKFIKSIALQGYIFKLLTVL